MSDGFCQTLLFAPQGISPRTGLPKLRESWTAKRAGDKVCTQMYYAKQGVITEEMAFVAAREGVDVEYVLSEVSMSPPPSLSLSLSLFLCASSTQPQHRLVSSPLPQSCDNFTGDLSFCPKHYPGCPWPRHHPRQQEAH